MSRFAVLTGEIEQELQNLDELVQRTEALRRKAEATGDADYLGTIALNLHGFYSGSERIFIPARVQELARSLPEAYELLRRDLLAFCKFLITANSPD